MKLLSSPTSPFARKVRNVALITGAHQLIEVVDCNPWLPDTPVPEHNPLGKVPALITDEGVIVDSSVICAYLDPDEILHPPGSLRWPALRMQALADGMMDATVLRRLETMRPEALRSSDWIARQVATIRRTLDALEATPDVHSDRQTIGHVALACALDYVDFRFAEEPWRDSHANLAKFIESQKLEP